MVVTVVANQTDSYHRLIRSLNVYRYKYEVYSQVNDDDTVRILRENLARYQKEKNTVILVVDAYNVIFTQGPEFVLNKFESFKPARIVFEADDVCWPDENLQYDYPLGVERPLQFGEQKSEMSPFQLHGAKLPLQAHAPQ